MWLIAINERLLLSSLPRVPSSTLIPFLGGLGSLIRKKGTHFKPRLLGSLVTLSHICFIASTKGEHLAVAPVVLSCGGSLRASTWLAAGGPGTFRQQRV